MQGLRRPVRVHLRSVQVDPDGNTSDLTHEYAGLLYDRPTERYVIFEEPDPKVTTSYKIKADELLVTRRGAINTTQTFRAGDWDYYDYQIGEGALSLKAHTRRLATQFSDEGGEIQFEYQLWSGEELLGDYTLSVRVVPAEPG